ncbi:MAG: YraN family protein [Ignavibacteria bacterium]
MKFFSKKELGDFGEAKAKEYLKTKGLKFIQSNFKYFKKEIDLIFYDKKNKIIIFVEVKTRMSKVFGEPEDAINHFKQINIRQAASGFLKNYPEYDEYDIRFDSVSVYMGNEKPEINHIENAF